MTSFAYNGKNPGQDYFGRKFIICQPIFKFFVALFMTFGMQKDSKITFCWMCFSTR